MGTKNFEQTLGDTGGQRSWHAIVHGIAKRWAYLSDSTIAMTILTGEPF